MPAARKHDDPRPLRLKYIEKVDFRKNEFTNFVETSVVGKGKKTKKRAPLKPGEVACLVSSSGNQIVFVYAPKLVAEDGGRGAEERPVLHSEKLRLTSGGRWHPLMLGTYAEQVGIKLEGIKLFEEHYDQMTRERVRLRRMRAG
jgi:hypothetical protein